MVRMMVTFYDGKLIRKKHDGSFWEDINILYLDLGMIYGCKNYVKSKPAVHQTYTCFM